LASVNATGSSGGVGSGAHEDKMMQECLDPFEDGGLQTHRVYATKSEFTMRRSTVFRAFRNFHTKSARCLRSRRDRACAACGRLTDAPSPAREFESWSRRDHAGPRETTLVLAVPIGRFVGDFAPSRPTWAESPVGAGYNPTPISTILGNDRVFAPRIGGVD
jgi:hypothetical protein